MASNRSHLERPLDYLRHEVDRDRNLERVQLDRLEDEKGEEEDVVYSVPNDDDGGDNRTRVYMSQTSQPVSCIYQCCEFLEGSRDIVRSSWRTRLRPLRALCFIGNFLIVLSASLGLVKLKEVLSYPHLYVLQLYAVLFGVMGMLVEAKYAKGYKRTNGFMVEWFKFLTVPLGRGMFYVFAGFLGISIWKQNFYFMISGTYLLFMGALCIVTHFSYGRQLKTFGIDATVSHIPHPPETHTPLLHDHTPPTYMDPVSDSDGEDIVEATSFLRKPIPLPKFNLESSTYDVQYYDETVYDETDSSPGP